MFSKSVSHKSAKRAFGIALVFLAASATLATDFALDWYTIDGGGQMWTTGGDFELSGTIGQSDANVQVLTSGDFQLAGGFWTAAVEEPFCPGDLDGDGDVDLADLAALLAAYGTTCE
jgi:hypothetical protein